MSITIDLSSLADGTYIIEDDGTVGNNISRVTAPGGGVVTTFAHPADSLTIISRAGQSVAVNFLDSLGTANFTIGNLVTASQRPDSIQINNVVTTGTVTLTANGAITESGSDVGTDITAGKLLVLAGTGVGAGNAIETQVALLDAESTTGGINLSNIGNVVIGGAGGGATLRGLFTGTSGDIKLINQGSITLADTDGIESTHSAGNIILNAIGAAADISSNVNRDALLANGNISLIAGRDVLFGTVGADFDNDVRAGGGINVTAARDFHIDGFSDMASDDQGLATNGDVVITVGRDILIDDANGVDASVGVTATNSTGKVVLTTGIGGTFLLHANSTAAVQGRVGGVLVQADRMLVDADSGITDNNGLVTLTTASAGRGITLGSATDGVVTLELSDAELDRIFSPNVVIGSVQAGAIDVAGALTHPNDNLTLRSGDEIFLNASITTPKSLTLFAAENITQAAASTVTTTTFAASADTPDSDLAGGSVSLNGTMLATKSSLSGNNDANDVLIGNSLNNVLIGLGGADTLNGLGGFDTADYSASDGRVVINLALGTAAGGHAQGDTLTSIENLIGTQFSNDILTGGTGDNVLAGLAGADTLNGNAGDDTADYSASDAAVSVNLATGRATGGHAQGDTLINIEHLIGSNFGDILGGTLGANVLAGGGGNDTADYSASDNRVVVNLNAGTAAGGHAQGDTLISIENLTGSVFDNDILTGNAGANVLAGLGGADTLDGQGGFDTADYSASDNRVVVNLAAGTAAGGHAQGDTLISIENLIGTPFANDILTGGVGDNVLAGLAGADTLNGNLGDDIADYSASGGRVVVNLATGYAAGGDAQDDTLISIENLIGTNFSGDILGGNGVINLLNGLAGNDTANYAASDARVVINLTTGTALGGHADGDILLNIENLIGSTFSLDNLTGNSLDNVLAGLDGADTLDGRGGNDTADYSASDNRVVVNLATSTAAGGHAQGDTLIDIENVIGTEFSNDILTGNGLANVLTGLAGADTFNFQGLFGADTVTDFQDEVDILSVSGAGALVSQLDSALGAQFTFANGSSILLAGVTVAQSVDDLLIS